MKEKEYRTIIPFGLLSTGKKAEVVGIMGKRGYQCDGKKDSHVCYAEDMGLRSGKIVKVLNNEVRGPLLIKVDESRIAINHGVVAIAMRQKFGTWEWFGIDFAYQVTLLNEVQVVITCTSLVIFRNRA